MNDEERSCEGFRRRRGRPRLRRMLESDLEGRCYEPCCGDIAGIGRVVLRRDDLEILRLIDLMGLTQEEAASIVGISRRSLWRDLHEARRKVVEALVSGKAIVIEGCSEQDADVCPGRRCRQNGRGGVDEP